MFSGIVKEIGTVSKIIDYGSDIIMTVQSSLTRDLRNGDSIAINGCCLTVTEVIENQFKVCVVSESINRTNLRYLRAGAKVNLECSITVSQPIGGHFVQGHIDSTAKIISIADEGRSKIISFSYPSCIAQYIVTKGYVALDGMSITVIEAIDGRFSVTLIPYTLENTIASRYMIGSLVNLEVDIIGRYIEKLINYTEK